MNVQLSDSGLWRTLSIESFIRVLLIDDNPADRCLFRRHLDADRKHNYDISEAGTAREAATLLEEQDFDCILLDYRLPGTDGIDYLQSLQASKDTSKIPVIVVTGEGDENLAVRCLRKGAVDYVPKDKISTGVFQRAIGNAIVQADMKRTIDEQTRSLTAANAELRTRNEEIQRFYHTVSHEIKTPLTAAREFVAIVLDGLVGDINEKQREMLSHALDSCDDIAKQFNDLVDCTRLETGKMRLRIERCSVEGVLQRSIVAASPALQGRQIKLKQGIVPGLPEPEMDGRRMVQVVSNLLTNAIKYTEPGGTITVLARRAGNSVEIEVRDTGCGISADHLPRVFDRLYQVGEGRDGLSEQGLGLGLAIAREIVNLHGGEIIVKSKVGAGSSFIVRLPLTHHAKETEKEVQMT